AEAVQTVLHHGRSLQLPRQYSPYDRMERLLRCRSRGPCALSVRRRPGGRGPGPSAGDRPDRSHRSRRDDLREADRHPRGSGRDRSVVAGDAGPAVRGSAVLLRIPRVRWARLPRPHPRSVRARMRPRRSEEHTSELQSRFDLVCRLLSSHPPSLFPYTTLFRSEAVEMTSERLTGIREGAAETDRSWQAMLAQLSEALRFYFEFHESDGLGYLAHIHDPFVLACALEWARQDRNGPEGSGLHGGAGAGSAVANGASGALPWAKTLRAPVDVELTGTLTRGETVADWLGRWG